MSLTDLPNIGKVMAKRLEAVGIFDYETLKEVGSLEAWFRIDDYDGSG